MENGLGGLKKDKEFGKGTTTAHMLDSGLNQKLKVLEFIFGQLETSMKVNGKTVSSMGKEQSHFQMEMCLQDSMRLEGQMVKDLTNGLTELITLEILWMD